MKDVYDPEALYLVCAPEPKDFVMQSNYQKCVVLTPENITEYKLGIINRNSFEHNYKTKLKSPAAHEYINYLKSLEQNVFLITGIDYGFLARNI